MNNTTCGFLFPSSVLISQAALILFFVLCLSVFSPFHSLSLLLFFTLIMNFWQMLLTFGLAYFCLKISQAPPLPLSPLSPHCLTSLQTLCNRNHENALNPHLNSAASLICTPVVISALLFIHLYPHANLYSLFKTLNNDILTVFTEFVLTDLPAEEYSTCRKQWNFRSASVSLWLSDQKMQSDT